MVKKLSCVSCGSLKRFPHTFTTVRTISVGARARCPEVGYATQHLFTTYVSTSQFY